jgi:S-adenosylmethionine hydrolase
MAIITLTSDWGTSDYYLAAVKGTILSQLPDVKIVDISHHIATFDVEGAAFTIRHCYRNFPQGTVHLIGINSEESSEAPHTIVKARGQYFIGADTGIFSMILEGEQPEEIIEIDIPLDSDFYTFSTRDRFVKAAVQLIKGTPLNDLGFSREEINKRLPFQPATTADSIKGMVIHVDAYENLITNISADVFKAIRQNRPFEIYSSGYRIYKISEGYQDVEVADLVALFGSHGLLEIAINQGKASSLMGIKRNTSVFISFTNR